MNDMLFKYSRLLQKRTPYRRDVTAASQLAPERYICRMKILMVCLGNICRSPLAEGILQQKVWKAGLNWSVESAGTEAYHAGEPPHRLSQKVSKLHGIDICKQRSRKFVKEDLLNFDKIYVMDVDNYAEVKRISKNLWNEKKVDLLLNELYPNENKCVPDPWYGGEDGYHAVFEMIDKACEMIVKREW